MSAVPKPQAPFTESPIRKRGPIACMGSPLSGGTTKKATAVNATAPTTIQAVHHVAPVNCASTAVSASPHSPPQKALDKTDGTPKGGMASSGHAARLGGMTPVWLKMY